MPLDPLFWFLVFLTFPFLVFLTLPFMGAPFILMHHFTFCYTHKHLLKGDPCPPLDRGDLKDACFWGGVMFAYQLVMWNVCGWSAIQAYTIVFGLGLVQHAWEVLTFWRKKRRRIL